MDEYLPKVFEGVFVTRGRIHWLKSGEYLGEEKPNDSPRH